MTRTELDTKIDEALANSLSTQAFDAAAYINAFSHSAEAKADSVIALLRDGNSPFCGKRPVFVSIGGGDGTELRSLLANTNAQVGILVEANPDLVTLARSTRDTINKKLEIYHGDAVGQIEPAITYARKMVESGKADFIAVTCHAVLHELYDRSTIGFDPLTFFASIFGDEQSPATWLTYREPGAPNSWPERVLVRANCSQSALLRLARSVWQRHEAFRKRDPPPQIVGDHVLMHRDLAMEAIIKLFYLEDLAYEIQERSTSIDHQELRSRLMIAIGKTAVSENRAFVYSISQPTGSFLERWQYFGVQVETTNDGLLPTPESQTRVVAWRKPRLQDSYTPESSRSSLTTTGPAPMQSDLDLARQAFRTNDNQLLLGLLQSQSRSWIESKVSDDAVELLRQISVGRHEGDPVHLWSRYILNLADLFSGHRPSPAAFSDPSASYVRKAGLSLLFEAEQMEFNRKARYLDESLRIANVIIPQLNRSAPEPTPLSRYCMGTAHYLVANLLRNGGRYDQAEIFVARAKQSFIAGIPSHDTELAHCEYSRAVCNVMTGSISAESAGSTSAPQQLFADALINLTYSHASWFTGDLRSAQQHAKRAQSLFEQVEYSNYARRATLLAELLEVWGALESGQTIGRLSGAVIPSYITGSSEAPFDAAAFAQTSGRLKPSAILGFLQFAKRSKALWEQPMSVPLPEMWSISDDGLIEKAKSITATSLENADQRLREFMHVPPNRRVPLLTD